MSADTRPRGRSYPAFPLSRLIVSRVSANVRSRVGTGSRGSNRYRLGSRAAT